MWQIHYVKSVGKRDLVAESGGGAKLRADLVSTAGRRSPQPRPDPQLFPLWAGWAEDATCVTSAGPAGAGWSNRMEGKPDSLQLYVCLGELWIYYKKQTPNIKTVDAIVFSRELNLQDAQREELAERTLMWKLTREAGSGEGKKQGSSLPRNSLRFPSWSTLCASGHSGKESPAKTGDTRDTSWPLGGEDPLEEEMATHSRVLAWETPWTEVPGGLQSVGLQSRTRLNSLNKKEVESGTSPSLSWQLPDL